MSIPARIVMTVCLLALPALNVLARPSEPFSSLAVSTAIQTTLNLVTANVRVTLGRQEARINAPNVATATTSGQGMAVQTKLTTGLLVGADVALVRSASSAQSTAPGAPSTDAASLLTADTLLVDSGVLTTTTTSAITTVAYETAGSGAQSSVTLYGNMLGTTPLLTAGSLTQQTTTQTSANRAVQSFAATELATVAIKLPGIDTPIVTLDSLNAWAKTINTGAAADAFAASDVEFTNLRIAGKDYSNAVAGTVVMVRQGLIDVARITILPIHANTAGATLSTAEAIALRVDVINVPGLAGTRIELGAVQASSGIVQPTAITLTSFTATPLNNTEIRLEWATATERNTLGFHLFRSTDAMFEHAVRVTPELIRARGDDVVGARYTWYDRSVQPDQRYTYWLQEIDQLGGAQVYGPAQAVMQSTPAQPSLFLPLVRQ